GNRRRGRGERPRGIDGRRSRRRPISTSSIVYAFATLFLRLTLSAVVFSWIMLIGRNSGDIYASKSMD
ncbi:unnamed protein product, partial [Musa acuminata subsp. burmannicoides]